MAATEPVKGELPDYPAVDIQWGIDPEDCSVDEVRMTEWIVCCAGELSLPRVEVSLRIVNSHEITDLNRRYGNTPTSTNVLSFPNGVKDESGCELLGDIAVCAPVVRAEATKQNKSEVDHFAHMVVHGLLHLCGYDHQVAGDAITMEAIEVKLLQKLGFKNPYFEIECHE